MTAQLGTLLSPAYMTTSEGKQMLSTRSIRRAVAIGVGAATVATTVAVVTTGPAQAVTTGHVRAAATGHAQLAATTMLCTTDSPLAVRSQLGGNDVLYIVGTGAGFRAVAGDYDGNWAYGHGNGHSNGWVKGEGLVNCVWQY